MALTPIWNATVKGGKLIFHEGEEMSAFMESMEGRRVEVRISRFRKERTVDQRSFYFGVVVELIREELGMSVEECHSFLKTILIYPKTSITQLDCAEFSRYIEEAACWAAVTLGIVIPEPQRVSWQ